MYLINGKVILLKRMCLEGCAYYCCVKQKYLYDSVKLEHLKIFSQDEPKVLTRGKRSSLPSSFLPLEFRSRFQTPLLDQISQQGTFLRPLPTQNINVGSRSQIDQGANTDSRFVFCQCIYSLTGST